MQVVFALLISVAFGLYPIFSGDHARGAIMMMTLPIAVPLFFVLAFVFSFLKISQKTWTYATFALLIVFIQPFWMLFRAVVH
jgi:hypothetical protein